MAPKRARNSNTAAATGATEPSAAGNDIRDSLDHANSMLAELKGRLAGLAYHVTGENPLAAPGAPVEKEHEGIQSLASLHREAKIHRTHFETSQECQRNVDSVAISGDSGLEKSQAELSEMFKLATDLQLQLDNGVDYEVDIDGLRRDNQKLLRLLAARMTANNLAFVHAPAAESRLKFAQSYYNSAKAEARLTPATYAGIHTTDTVSKWFQPNSTALAHANAAVKTRAAPPPAPSEAFTQKPKNPPYYPGGDKHRFPRRD